MKKTKRCIGLLFATALLGACTSQGDANSSDTSIASSTTLPVKAMNPQIELDALAKRVDAVDYSRLSINHEGIFAVILRDKRVGGVTSVGTFTFWRWDGKLWNDVSGSIVDRPVSIDFFEPRSNFGASVVTSYDFNKDGVIDFLVEFNEKNLGLNHAAGGILSNRGGEWHWESFMFLDGTIAQAGESFMFDTESNILSFRDYPAGYYGYQADSVELYWDSERKMFVADQNSYTYDGY
jgi:hypothetical protein